MKRCLMPVAMGRVLSVPVCSYLVAGMVMAGMLMVAGGVHAAEHHVYPGQSIQAAMDAAGPGDTVIVHQGTYYERIDFKGKAITVRSVDPTDPAVVGYTVIDGGAGGSVVTFTSGEGNSSALAGLTITNGSASIGGGIYCWYSSPTIQNNTISGNNGLYDAGGIYCYYSSATIQSNTINGNSVSFYGYGGGIYCRNSSPTIQSNTIVGNRARYSGGIFCYYSSATIDSNTISGNSADRGSGGGIYCVRSSPAIQSNTISDNQASRYGAGIYCETSSPTIADNTISGNSGCSDGGGILCGWDSSATIENNTISGNSAGRGGGIYCGSSATIERNTIAGNSASYYGGGIFCAFSPSPATIQSNTVSANSASYYGGGICCYYSSPTITNTIVAFSTNGGGIANTGTGTPAVTYCDVHGNAGGEYVGMADPTGLDGNMSLDPLFADAAGGDFHLRSEGGRWDPGSSSWVIDAQHSPCIDTGDLSSDCSNEPAPSGGRINMGVYGNTPQASKSKSVDEDPPTLSLDSPSPAILWPPNHKAVAVTISGSVVDEGSGVAHAWLEVDDEYDELDGSYGITAALDEDGNFSISLDLIAWREGNDRDGRVYEISLHATDVAGNEAEPVSVVVWVPHDQRRNH